MTGVETSLPNRTPSSMKGIFLDLETSGLDPSRHCVLEIALKIIDLQSGQELAQYERVIHQSDSEWEKRDPIAIRHNGFTKEKLDSGDSTDKVRCELIDLFAQHDIQRGRAVFICQNPSFDRGFFRHIVPVYTQEDLLWPYHWLDFASMYWAKRVQAAQSGEEAFPRRIQLSKDNIAQFHHLPTEARPHRAINGVDHLLACYQEVVGWIPPASSTP